MQLLRVEVIPAAGDDNIDLELFLVQPFSSSPPTNSSFSCMLPRKDNNVLLTLMP